MVFRIASSPYIHNQRQTSRIMMLVCTAALRYCRTVLVFGWGTLFQLVLGCASAVAAEAAILKLRKMEVTRILSDNSALLTGLLLAISIPPFAPWWMVVLGTVFAVIIAKQLYGGLGHNPFNPAMIGYVVLLISFPVQMTSWLPPHEIAATVPGFMDALHVIFTGHTALGADMNALRMGVDGISRHPARYLQNLPACRTQRGAGDEIVYLQRRTGGCWLAVGQSGLFVGRRVPAATEGDPLAYSGELHGDAGRLLDARLGHLT